MLRENCGLALVARGTVASFILMGIAACQTGNASNNNSSGELTPRPEPAPAPSSEPNVDVYVEGADAQASGDTITLEYPESNDINDRIPDWVINPAMGGVTGSVGVAAKNDLGTREQLDEARMNGRLELASMLELRLQRVGRTELEQDIRVESGVPNNSSRRDTIGVDRNILDIVLAGSRQRALWFNRDNQEVYVWMVFDGAVFDRVDHRVSENVSVFLANTPIRSEYKPKRNKPQAPTVIVSVPQGPELPRADEEPETPIEELEGQLQPIETVPVQNGGTGAGDSGN